MKKYFFEITITLLYFIVILVIVYHTQQIDKRSQFQYTKNTSISQKNQRKQHQIKNLLQIKQNQKIKSNNLVHLRPISLEIEQLLVNFSNYQVQLFIIYCLFLVVSIPTPRISLSTLMQRYYFLLKLGCLVSAHLVFIIYFEFQSKKFNYLALFPQFNQIFLRKVRIIRDKIAQQLHCMQSQYRRNETTQNLQNYDEAYYSIENIYQNEINSIEQLEC